MGQSGFFNAFILLVASHVADSVKVIVGDQLKVPVNCEPGESVSLQRITINGPRDVATGQSGQWKVSREEDRDRIEMDSSNIIFTHTLFTDGGIYELKCSTSGSKETVQLEIVFASKVSVTQGETVTLPCYFEAFGETDLTRWEKTGKPVCVKNSNSEGCSGTRGDRLTVSTDWTNTGDLSLTIEGAQLEDGGDYFCYIQDQRGKQSGTPAAVRLTVTEKKTHQMISSTAAPGNPTQNCAGHTQPWQMSTSILAAILLVLIFYLWCSGKLRCDSGKLYEVVRRSCPASNSGEAATINKLDDRVSHVAGFV